MITVHVCVFVFIYWYVYNRYMYDSKIFIRLLLGKNNWLFILYETIKKLRKVRCRKLIYNCMFREKALKIISIRRV